MSNSDDKTGSKAGEQKSSAPKPLKRARKRQASRPPTIEGKAVRLEAETAGKTASGNSNRKKEKSEPVDNNSEKVKVQADAGKSKAGFGIFKDTPSQLSYRDLALSASIGAAVSIVLLAGVLGAQFFSSDQQELESKIATLSAEIVTLNDLVKNPPASESNTKAISLLTQQVSELAKQPEAPLIMKISKQIKANETSIAELQNPAVDATDLKNLSARLDALDLKAEEVKASAENASRRADIVEQVVKAADEAIKGSTDGIQGSTIAQNLRLANIEDRLKRLSEDLDSLKGKTSDNSRVAYLEKITTGLVSKNEALDGLVAAANSALESSKTVTSSLDERLTRLEQDDKSDSTGRLAALSFAMESLLQKIKSGEVFQKELDIVSVAFPQNTQLEKLSDQAGAGVKSIAWLQREFAPVLRAVLAAEDTVAAPGVMAKLVGTAKSLVRIRRVGEVEGDSREAIIARLETRINAGNMAAALVEAKKLKGASAKTAASWVGLVEERVKTIEFINDLRNEVISGLEPGQ